MSVEPSDAHSFKKAILDITNDHFIYNPQTEDFIQNFSLNRISNLYNKIFSKVS